MTPTDTASPWYRDFFDSAYLALYADRINEKQTKREVQMVETALQLAPGARILDLACGTGRHSVLLARHGHHVTGVDLNEGYLAMARQAASAASVKIDTVACDMREIPFEGCFDAVVSLFTSFGYFEAEEDDQAVVQRVADALKPGGSYLIDAGNRDWQLESGEGEWGEAPNGGTYHARRDYDPVTSILTTTFSRAMPGLAPEEVGRHGIRLYTLTELVRLLGRAGLKFSRAYGDYRCKPYSVRTPRMIVVAEKPA